MRTNADAEREMWKLTREELNRNPNEEITVTRYWFPVPMNASLKGLVAACPADLEARIETVEGDDRLVIWRKK